MGGYPNPETRVSEKDFRLQKEESHFVIVSSVMKVRVGKEKKKKRKKKGLAKKRKILKKEGRFHFPVCFSEKNTRYLLSPYSL